MLQSQCKMWRIYTGLTDYIQLNIKHFQFEPCLDCVKYVYDYVTKLSMSCSLYLYKFIVIIVEWHIWNLLQKVLVPTDRWKHFRRKRCLWGKRPTNALPRFPSQTWSRLEISWSRYVRSWNGDRTFQERYKLFHLLI